LPPPRSGDESLAEATADRAVQRWLVWSALAVVVAIAIGGITRLTESGLSITEWKPVSGVLPPLTATDWNDAFARYLSIPEAQTVHRGISLGEFKGLYWWEWVHRMLARGVGLVLTVPYFVLLLRGRIRASHRLRLANLPILAALQGGLGWYMVSSGLAGRTSVSPYRLTAHLSLALVILGVALWTAAGLRRTDGVVQLGAPRSVSGVVRLVPLALTCLALVTLLSGGFVAGLDAGQIFNTFPLMEGRLVPEGYGSIPGWRNAFENPVAAQLHHRILALVTMLLVVIGWIGSERARSAPQVRHWLRLAALVVVAQAVLGVATLLLAVPISLAVLHQLGGVTLFATLLMASEAAGHWRATR
jgi:cytochrome c oxidase assembly protein subunit 15